MLLSIICRKGMHFLKSNKKDEQKNNQFDEIKAKYGRKARE